MAGRTWDDPWQRYPESRPLPADGVATSKQRGAMSATWWSKRFVDALESYGLGGRMQRGRRYARTGQVLGLDVSDGLIASQVQGSRRTPYMVTVKMVVPTKAQWRKIDDAMASRVGFAARLLAGEMPSELEAVFATARTTLLPERWEELTTKCSCPDWENPCKHIAAVLYVFADQLDADPWLLLAWRGRSRDEVLAAMRNRTGIAAATSAEAHEIHVAPWWPFSTRERIDELNLDRPMFADAPEPADPVDAVLARCDELNATLKGTPLVSFLTPAYEVFANRADPDER